MNINYIYANKDYLTRYMRDLGIQSGWQMLAIREIDQTGGFRNIKNLSIIEFKLYLSGLVNKNIKNKSDGHNCQTDVGFLYLSSKYLNDIQIDGNALQYIYQGLMSNQTGKFSGKDFITSYKKAYNKLLKMTTNDGSLAGYFANYTGWIYIESGQDKDKKYQQDIRNFHPIFNSYQKRQMFLWQISQNTGWCTGRNMHQVYLPQCSFWRYLENGKAKASVRVKLIKTFTHNGIEAVTTGDIGNEVQQMQGTFNSNANGYMYASQYLQLANKYPDINIQQHGNPDDQADDESYNGITFLGLKKAFQIHKQLKTSNQQQLLTFVVGKLRQSSQINNYLTEKMIHTLSKYQNFTNLQYKVFRVESIDYKLNNMNKFQFLRKDENFVQQVCQKVLSLLNYENGQYPQDQLYSITEDGLQVLKNNKFFMTQLKKLIITCINKDDNRQDTQSQGQLNIICNLFGDSILIRNKPPTRFQTNYKRFKSPRNYQEDQDVIQSVKNTAVDLLQNDYHAEFSELNRQYGDTLETMPEVKQAIINLGLQYLKNNSWQQFFQFSDNMGETLTDQTRYPQFVMPLRQTAIYCLERGHQKSFDIIDKKLNHKYINDKEIFDTFSKQYPWMFDYNQGTFQHGLKQENFHDWQRQHAELQEKRKQEQRQVAHKAWISSQQYKKQKQIIEDRKIKHQQKELFANNWYTRINKKEQICH